MTEQGSYAFAIPGVFRLFLNRIGLYRTQPYFEFLPPELRTVAYGIDYNSRTFALFRSPRLGSMLKGRPCFGSAGPLPDVPLIVIVHGLSGSATRPRRHSRDCPGKPTRSGWMRTPGWAQELLYSGHLCRGGEKRSQHPFGTATAGSSMKCLRLSVTR